jgi:DNA (cytosine-5)-methyltransferase 1
MIGGEEHRPTTQELARVASFPESFAWAGNANEQWNRIGNSVPPNLMLAIAQTIRTEILDKIKPGSTPALQSGR